MKDVPPGIVGPSKDQIEGRTAPNVAQEQNQKLPPMYDPVGQAAEEDKKIPATKVVKF